MRTLADSSTSGLTLTSRLGNDVTVAYPELAGLAEIADDVLLDGEIVSLVDGRPSFNALQSRMHVRKAVEARRLAAARPGTYLAFDVLRLYGVDLTGRTFAERRATLERLEVAGPHWTVSPAVRRRSGDRAGGRRERAGGRAWPSGCPRSTGPATRSNDWIKVGCGTGRSSSSAAGSTARAAAPAGSARCCSACTRRPTWSTPARSAPASPRRRCGAWRSGCDRTWLDSSPFVAMPPDVRGRPITWVRPEVVVEVEFAEWTVDGRLRFASFQGVRTDKRPEEVVREQ